MQPRCSISSTIASQPLPSLDPGLVTPAAERRRVLHLQVGDVGFRSSCLASRAAYDCPTAGGRLAKVKRVRAVHGRLIGGG
eukprot:scaffold132721_cov30-Phaeocystis_antarctica.AAC.1